MKRIIWALTIVFALIPLTATADSPPRTEVGQPIAIIKPLKPMAVPAIAEVPEAEPIAVPAPAPTPAPVVSTPAPATGGCVTGWSSGDYYLDKIVAYESGGNSCATNPGGCFGLLQACPGSPLKYACGGDPGCQIEWFQANKTGGRSWAEVWQHEVDYGWW